MSKPCVYLYFHVKYLLIFDAKGNWIFKKIIVKPAGGVAVMQVINGSDII